MATASSSASAETKLNLVKEIRTHEVAVAELGHLPASRPVYQKTGNLFFRTTIQKATASEQSKKQSCFSLYPFKLLDSAKAKLGKLNSS
ncbi:unnamed protein product [Linum tenue]|uniref:Uncharacterized protein n=1 Tax=Linum tenue TaxID=586396 RepID=A0AAV0QBL6_9ROSI|nr:unnamed protein product [Linum tenue]